MSERTVQIRKAAKERLRWAARRRGADLHLQELSEQEVLWIDKKEAEERTAQLEKAKAELETLMAMTDEQWQTKANEMNALWAKEREESTAELSKELAGLLGERDDVVRWGELHPDEELQAVLVHALESADHDINEVKSLLESVENTPSPELGVHAVKLALLATAQEEVERWAAPPEKQPLTKNRRKWAKFHRSLADS